MTKPLHPLALFRLSVLGPLASRDQLEQGELKKLVRELSTKSYTIPGVRRMYLSEQTIMRWFYEWKRGGVEALNPKVRCDKGRTQLSEQIQAALLQVKQANPARSINTLIDLLERQGFVAKNKLARATVHRFLQQQKMSKRILADPHTIERRSFVAKHAGALWQGDVLHGSSLSITGQLKKTYLISLMDDASRLIVHSAFCLGETALDIEGVLKQAILKRGIPFKLILDNGAGYRSQSLQSICASLEIRIIYCRPHEPEGKGKLEKFHSTFRSQFLNEINIDSIMNLADLNARLWAWLDQVYHQRAHGGLAGKTPLERWREDIIHVRPLGLKADIIDDLFYHRCERVVRKDATVQWEGNDYEVPHGHVGQKVILVFDPHTQLPIRIESAAGHSLGPVVLLDRAANLYRKRQRPHAASTPKLTHGETTVELAYNQHKKQFELPQPIPFSEEEK